MCGIAGEVDWSSCGNFNTVATMVSGIIHRGPDDRGVWSSPQGECVLGHARLSIIDLSFAGHQPMFDPLTGNAIVFNGEIYNFQSLRKDCENAGEIFKSHSDTEVILTLYRRYGIDCLKFLRGMFAFAIWDEQQRRLLLARDRVGKKPLNYAITKNGIVFCSELHPLSHHAKCDNALDMDALALYLQCQFIPAPWTIYRGIRKLPPAHFAIFDGNGLTIQQYWDIDYRRKIRINEADALDAFEEKLTEAVRLRMIADAPLGALLSGGVDSSVVVALMAKITNEPIRTFSIGFEEQAFNELPWAKQAAERSGAVYHPEIAQGNIEELLPKLARHYGEPYADTSSAPSFMVSAAARRFVSVALNGDGGDELLGGYPRYSLQKPALYGSALFGGWLPPARLADLSTQLLYAKSFSQKVIRKLLIQYINPEFRSVLMFSDYWNDSERRLLLPEGSTQVLSDWRRSWVEKAFSLADNPVERMLYLDNHTYLPDCLLVKMDIASMHCGLETRSPFLDHEVIEFCASLPVQYKVKDQIGKHLLKKLAERFFPNDFIYRRKMGFTPPIAAWLQGPLKNVLLDTLMNERLMQPLSNKVINSTLKEFQAGNHDHVSRLWALLMFGIWRAQK